jgi:hypothetical protein
MDQRSTSSTSPTATKPENLGELPSNEPRFAEVWDGILHEFRNHLRVLVAAATELRAEMPPSLALQVSEAVLEAERNVASLGTLLSLADASLRHAEAVVCPLDHVLDRAIHLTAPAVGRSVSITLLRGHTVGVRNRGTALECLLAALIIELARAAEGRGGEAARRSPRISLRAEAERSALTIELESDGPAPSASSWRLLLANDLATRLNATLTTSSCVAGFTLQLL